MRETEISLSFASVFSYHELVYKKEKRNEKNVSQIEKPRGLLTLELHQSSIESTDRR